jgi:hypothetical protein
VRVVAQGETLVVGEGGRAISSGLSLSGSARACAEVEAKRTMTAEAIFEVRTAGEYLDINEQSRRKGRRASSVRENSPVVACARDLASRVARRARWISIVYSSLLAGAAPRFACSVRISPHAASLAFSGFPMSSEGNHTPSPETGEGWGGGASGPVVVLGDAENRRRRAGS